MVKKIAYSSMLLAISLIFSYVENCIPIQIGIPGVKLGLANLVVLTGMYYLDNKNVFLILISRIIICGFMFGNLFSIIYSLAGGLLSFLVMQIMKNICKISIVNVSIFGGISHNVGQMIIAAIILNNSSIAYYLPVLIIAGIISGFLVGIIGKEVQYIFNKRM